MRYYKVALSVLAISVLGALLASTVSLQSQSPDTKSKKKQHQIDESQWPIAEYETSVPKNERERSLRHSRSKKFDKSEFELNPSSVSEYTFRTHSATDDLPSLPIAQSDVIITGEVMDANAYLSNDKSGVYSEFTVRVEGVFKNGSIALPPDNLITIQREGGRVRLPSGRTHLYYVSKDRMPSVGQRYMFFLKRPEEGDVFSLLTGYKLKDGKVHPLDKHKQFETYQSSDETVLVNEVKKPL